MRFFFVGGGIWIPKSHFSDKGSSYSMSKTSALYTSYAADEGFGVDIDSCCITKKKKKHPYRLCHFSGGGYYEYQNITYQSTDLSS